MTISPGVIALGAVGIFAFGLAIGFLLGRHSVIAQAQAQLAWEPEQPPENLSVGDPYYSEPEKINLWFAYPNNWWLWPVGLIIWAGLIWGVTKLWA